MKYSIPLVAILCLGLLVGCKTTPPPMQKALYVTTVATGVAFGVERYPEAAPYLRVAEPIICAAGNGTNVTPVEIVAALQNSPAANAVATPEGKLILNGALVLYISLFDSYGTDWVSQQEQLKTYLGWTCLAIGQGLPPLGSTNSSLRSAVALRKLPPHIR